MMEIIVNGEKCEIPNDLSIKAYLDSIKRNEGAFAVALNSQFVSKNKHQEVLLKNNDILEIVSPHPGG